MNNTNQRGFTLIELLVVIAIIGILSSIVLVSLNTARIRAANSRRLADVKQIKIALQLYFVENGQYPINTNDVGCSCDYSHLPLSAPDFIAQLEPTYMPGVPLDPMQDASVPNLVYKYVSDGSTYTLQFNIGPNGQGNNCPINAPAANPGGGGLWCTTGP